MVGQHHRLSGHVFEQTPGVGLGQGGLACCSPWGRKESDTTEELSWTEVNILFQFLFCTDITFQSSFRFAAKQSIEISHFSSAPIHALLFSCCVRLCCSPMNCSPPGSCVHGISREEYWSVLPFPSPPKLHSFPHYQDPPPRHICYS